MSNKTINSYISFHTSKSSTRNFATGLFSLLIPYKSKRNSTEKETIKGSKVEKGKETW